MSNIQAAIGCAQIERVAELIKKKIVESVHDVSEGGLLISLLESSFSRELGFDVGQSEDVRKDAYWFGEVQGRIVVSVNPSWQQSFLDFMVKQQIVFSELGKVAGNNIVIENENWGSIADWKNKYDNAITVLLKGQENEQALSPI